jgi:hypothetical protein
VALNFQNFRKNSHNFRFSLKFLKQPTLHAIRYSSFTRLPLVLALATPSLSSVRPPIVLKISFGCNRWRLMCGYFIMSHCRFLQLILECEECGTSLHLMNLELLPPPLETTRATHSPKTKQGIQTGIMKNIFWLVKSANIQILIGQRVRRTKWRTHRGQLDCG